MNQIKYILTLFLILNINNLVAQEKIGWKEVYTADHNDLTYKISNDEIFTGIVQWKHKNGHLKYEEEYKNGIILCSNLYYNGKEKRVSNKTIYNPNKPSVLLKEHKYSLENEIFETTTYNDDGIKILVEQFTNGKLTYSCEYLNKKKHGKEFCYAKNGESITVHYKNGRKIK
ncbi:hypothetical protein J8L88_16855 [Aquimarina sp. MMG015]|uniref:hypothetical protein n=1 Tax=Aquimarina sp. MMG015 TaxID=2822689 RepID=UPI001B3A5F32|nr:hypothetical protein [Aquimarina sp. MMG015]MBQ4804533.1 hypothetical protein [Aquimarina sp. MMG015]